MFFDRMNFLLIWLSKAYIIECICDAVKSFPLKDARGNDPCFSAKLLTQNIFFFQMAITPKTIWSTGLWVYFFPCTPGASHGTTFISKITTFLTKSWIYLVSKSILHKLCAEHFSAYVSVLNYIMINNILWKHSSIWSLFNVTNWSSTTLGSTPKSEKMVFTTELSFTVDSA